MTTRLSALFLVVSACCATVLLVLLTSAGLEIAPSPALPAEGNRNGESLEVILQEANEDLDAMAQELAQLVASPGFRGFIRSEIAQTKNREGILDLDPFLERASRRQDAPPVLSGFRERGRKAKAKLTAANPQFKGYDLYIPVEAHRTKWRGGDDLVVASGPFGDESEITQIVAYSVRNGEKILLDAQNAPDTVVLILAPCEHETHEQLGETEKATPQDRVLPKADATGQEPQEKPVKQSEGNSWVGLHRMYIRDVEESWFRGNAEIKVVLAQRNGSRCEEDYTGYGSLGLGALDDPGVWHTTWRLDRGAQCWDTEYVCAQFQDDWPTKMYVRIYERDSGWTQREYVFDLYAGVSCSIIYYEGDDYVDSGFMYRNNFPFDYDFNHDMGNAYVKWYKIH